MPNELKLTNGVLAFRGYNVKNLGRSPEILADRAYGPVVRRVLEEASAVCAEVVGREIDLVGRIKRREETTLETYDEAIAMIVAMEVAQLKLLSTFHGVDHQTARVSVGFSLGEIAALVAGGVYEMRDALRIPLAMAADCADLAKNVSMGVLFSRGESISVDRVDEVCLKLNAEGKGVLGVSAWLSPNSLLVMGTEDTVERLKQHLSEILPQRIYLRMNEHHWPPLHTPIVWERNITDRASVMLHTLPGGFSQPRPPVLSMVTGKESYHPFNSREIISSWIDHTQQLWDVVYELLSMGVELVVHVGPQPNILPATFDRLAANVEAQTRGSRRMRALSAVIGRPWLQNLLPRRAALLRAPLIVHVTLEDWLLENSPGAAAEKSS
ncbi:MAG: ACP S-malonyltransferase [Planctomycetaceae bacterium]|nr:ACP S-malonyltransferase [Planctomycetaceae bacterium]